jgi:hypothetical protein
MEPLYALQALGEFGSAMSKSSIDTEHQLLHIGPQTYPLDQLTPARRTAGARKGEPYTLRDIYVALLHMDTSLREYVAYCQKHGVNRLMEAERKELVKFMLGELSFEESALFDRSTTASADQGFRAPASLEPMSSIGTAPNKHHQQSVEAFAQEQASTGERGPVEGDQIEFDVNVPDQGARRGVADESVYVARCIAMERVQRTCDVFFELDKRKKIEFTSFPIIEALRKSVAARLPQETRAAEHAMAPGRISTEKQSDLSTRQAPDIDIARGDRYRTDTQRAYREAGLEVIETLKIDPAAGFASGAATSLDSENHNLTSAETALKTTSSVSSPISTSRSERDRVTSSVGNGHRSVPRGRAATKEGMPTIAGGVQKHVGTGHETAQSIIIVPSGQQPLITMLNIKSFVESGTFVSQEELRKQGIVRKPSARLQICHRGQWYTFTDQPTQLSAEEWKRVVVVVCQGATWQFKGWPFPGGPAQLFAAIRGVYFYYEDEQIPSVVRQWAVKCIPIHRHRRYTDEGAAREFWSMIIQAARRANYA